MSAEWYLKVADKEIGPLTAQQLRTMAAGGKLNADDVVRRGEEGPWVPASRVKGLLPAEEPAKPAAKPAAKSAAAAKSAEKPKPAAKKAPAKKAPVKEVEDEETEDEAEPETKKPLTVTAVAVQTPAEPVVVTSGPGPGEQPGNWPKGTSSRGVTLSLAEARAHSRKKSRQQIAIILLVVLVPTIAVGVFFVLNRDAGGKGGKKGKAVATADKGDAEKEKTEEPNAEGDEGKKTKEADAEKAAPEAPAEAAAVEWSNAETETVKCGDLMIKVESAAIGRPKRVLSKKEKDFFVLTLDIENTNKDRKFDFRWKTAGYGKLKDDRSPPNDYQAIPNPSIADSVSDANEKVILYFEKPLEKAQALLFELPGAALKQSGQVRFKISRDMVKPLVEAAAKPAVADDFPATRAAAKPANEVDGAIAGTAPVDSSMEDLKAIAEDKPAVDHPAAEKPQAAEKKDDFGRRDEGIIEPDRPDAKEEAADGEDAGTRKGAKKKTSKSAPARKAATSSPNQLKITDF